MKILLCIAVLFAFWSVVPAQDKVIDQATFETAVGNGAPPAAKLRGSPYRWTFTTDVRNEGKPEVDYAMKTVMEHDAAGAVHSTSESKFGPKVSKGETVRIGDTIYRRTGDGEWTQTSKKDEESRIPPPPPARENPYEITEQAVEYKQGSELYKGKTVQTYLRINTDKSVVKSNGQIHESHRTAKYWINDEGVILKAELRSLNKTGQQIQTIAILNDWDFDVDVHVTAPK